MESLPDFVLKRTSLICAALGCFGFSVGFGVVVCGTQLYSSFIRISFWKVSETKFPEKRVTSLKFGTISRL